MKQGASETRKTAGGTPLFRTLLTAFSVVAALSCVSVGLLTYFVRAAEIRGQEYHLLETLRDEKTASMSAWFAERAGDLSVMVARPDIIDFLESQRGAEPVLSAQVAAALATMQKAYRYEAVFLADREGKILASTEVDAYTPGSLPLREHNLRLALDEKRYVVSDVLISRIHKKPTLFMFMPVRAQGAGDVIGVLGILLNPSVWLYPQFARSKYLGETGEMLLVNREGIAQSPLKHRDGAISSLTLDAEPARRGASGATGIVAVEDYRQEPVMAAYGHIREFNWGIVVKQDMAEINAPVRAMARKLAATSAGVLVVVLVFGLLLCRRISRPALTVAAAAVKIGEGDLSSRAVRGGPAEIQNIAVALNVMAERLALADAVIQGVREVVSSVGKHSNIRDLFADVLPLLMARTRSQLGVVYLVDATGGKMERMLAHGLDASRITKRFTIDPPDHYLAQSLAENQVQVLNTIPEGHEMAICTHAGETSPRALLAIPLVLRDGPLGVIGLASLYDYDSTAQEIADKVRISLAQAVELCGAFEASETMRIELDEGNQELTASNAELQSKSEELEHQADELRTLADELEAQKTQVSQADRLKSEFLSNMSHELRTPLNSVLSLSQLMLENGEGTAGGEDKERLEIIERNGRRLLNLINDILDLSKIESGKMELFVSSFPAREPIHAVVASIRPLVNEKGLSVTVEAAEMDDMRSDKDKLQQILLNLLSNAQKFTEKGEIRVTVRQSGESAVFSVRDTGHGISKDDLPHIFDEFRQVDGSTTRQHGGTGLGLAICQRLTALLGGEIDVQSEVGKGTTVTFTLPLVIRGERKGPREDATAQVHDVQEWQAGSEPPRILLVEDNNVAIDQVTRALKVAGFIVDVAKNGEEGLSRTREIIPDGVILDLMMPKIDGFQVLEVIRSKPETARLPVLVLTAKDLTAAERARLSHNNVQQLIQKGDLDRAALVSAVRRLVGMQEAPVTEKAPPAEPAPRVVRQEGGKVTVLVVDDSADNLTTTKSILGGMNLEILEAMNGKEAVTLAGSRRPDVILMDIQMPVMSGIEATQRIKQDESLRNIVIIALTASAMMGDREEILAAGCDDYLSKPVEPRKLKAMLEKWIGGGAV
jgi:signal transduction histidine kinase/DNA-binding response OmpR family regulator